VALRRKVKPRRGQMKESTAKEKLKEAEKALTAAGVTRRATGLGEYDAS